MTGNLLHLMPESMPYIAVGLKVDVAYLDFRKALDTVDVVPSKVASIGCTPHTLKFFSNYIRDRRQ